MDYGVGNGECICICNVVVGLRLRAANDNTRRGGGAERLVGGGR